MARQVGHIKYSGTIGEVRHFKIKGLSGNYAGLKGGATAEQIKSDPVFKRTRENMNEFGGCAIAARSVRSGLSALMKQMSDAQLAGRLTGIMKKINLADETEARGVRAILISTQSEYLKNLNFNKHVGFDSVFYAPFTLTNEPDRKSSVLMVEAFNPSNTLKAPNGATHFRLINALSIVSDFSYNSTTKMYEAVNSELNEVSKITYSDFLDITKAIENPVPIISIFPSNVIPDEHITVLNSVGIEFYQKVGSEYYGNALKIQQTF